MLNLGNGLAALKNLLWRGKENQTPFSDLFVWFQDILKKNNAAMELIADMGGKMGGEFIFDKKYLSDNVKKLGELVRSSAYDLNYITDNQYLEIYGVIEDLAKKLEIELSGKMVIQGAKRIYHLNEIEDGMEDLVGYKAYNLSRILNLSEVNVPESFAVTVGGFRDYMAYNNLFEKIEDAIEECKNEQRSVESVSNAIRLMILGGEIPPILRRQILAAAEQISNRKPGSCYFAIRSSGVGEDGDLSFAGLHDSFLNVQFDELLSNYKKVLASLYNQASLEYRLRMNILSLEMAMPVLYQKMIRSHVSGVLFTLDPNRPERPESLLSGSWGLGKVVVDGEEGVDTFRISRSPPYPILERQIRSKPTMETPPEKGPSQKDTGEANGEPCLTSKEIPAIMDVGLILERYFKRPLDVEWSLDEAGQLWILQARQINMPRPKRMPSTELKGATEGHRVLLKDRGMIAYRGIGAGPVWVVEDGQDLNHFPSGGVLVSHFAPPWLAKAIPRATAIITDVGAVTGHMATVAREFRVPTIVGAEVATQLLARNQEVTVDSERNVVYEGLIQELIHHQLLNVPSFEMTHEFQLLRRLLKKIAPLSLTDPDAPGFTPKGCRTFHDVMRFVHEKAFRALVQAGRDSRSFLRRGGKRLRSHLPLDLVLIDIGGGLAEGVGKDMYVEPDQITSLPMKALWQGLSSPNAWSTEPIPVDFKGLMSSLTRTQSAETLGNALPSVNLAVLGSNYLNLSLPLGYHFTAVDASIGSSPENNNISFRFVGGVTDITRRSRRASLLANIMEKAGFKVRVNGDLVIARAINLSEKQMLDQLLLIGKLIGFARQLDVLMKNDEDIDYYFQKFREQLKKPVEDEGGKNGKDDSLYSG
jgi:pyruvate,water dikinase